MEDIQLSLFGKTCPEPTRARAEKISEPFSKNSRGLPTPKFQFLDLRNGGTLGKFWQTDSVLLGGRLTRNIGECPKDVKESTLSQILEADVPEKYYLSATACRGILRRAKKRGKELPNVLKEVLERQCMTPEEMGGGIVSPTITGDHNGHISDYTAICVAGFIGKNSPGAGSIGYHKGQVPTLRAGVQADVMCFDTTQITSPDNRSNPQYGSENIVCMAHGQANAEILENISPTLNCNHEQPIIDSPIVRRLTTLECCWLQGFPDRWCSIPILESFSDGEYNFWVSVRNDYNRMNGIAEKQYTKKTMIKWYNGLGTDSAQYKMWGNGIALPCALYVMQGIAELWEG